MSKNILYQKNRKVKVYIGYVYIICPTSGGYFIVEEFDGFIKCPPYNRVCSSSRFVSDIFDAVFNNLTIIDMDFTFPSYYLLNDNESFEEDFNSLDDSINEEEKSNNFLSSNNDYSYSNFFSSNEESSSSYFISYKSDEIYSSYSNIYEKSSSNSYSFLSSNSKDDEYYNSSSKF